MKNSLSISSLLSRLVNTPSPRVVIPSEFNDKKVNTTVRMEPAVKAFIEAEAEKLGISAQEFVAMTFKAIMVATHAPVESELELMLSRFAELFKAHSVPVAEIPLLVPEIKRSELMDTKQLVDRLDNSVLAKISDIFMVDEAWLQGQNCKPYGNGGHTWYKNLEGFGARLAYLQWQSRNVRVYFCVDYTTDYEQLCEAKDEGDRVDPRDMCVVVECERSVNGVGFRTYDLWEAQRWNYGNCRLFLKLMMCLCQMTRVYYDGIKVPQQEFAALCNGTMLAAQAFKYRRTWHPDQLLRNDDRNKERDEIEMVENYLKDYEKSMKDITKALEDPSSVTNWETCLREGFRF